MIRFQPGRRRTGFNLLELLVIVVIIMMVVAFLVPAVQKLREASQRTEVINGLKQMSLALHSCNDVYRKLPPAYSKCGLILFPASTHVHLLPFVEQEPLYKDYAKQMGGGATKEAVVKPYLARTDPSLKMLKGVQNFAANLRVFADAGIGTAYNQPIRPEALGDEVNGSAGIPRTFVDGTSNTIVFSTKLAECGDDGGSRYASQVNTKYAAFIGQNAAKAKAAPSDPSATFQLMPDQKQCLTTPLMAQSFDRSGIFVGLGDGSVRMLSTQISAQTWNSAMQPNDGNPLGADWD